MTKISFAFQGVTKTSHSVLINKMLERPGLRRALISVAFAKVSGVAEVSDALELLANKATCFVGIRNGVTSSQALLGLLSLGVKLFTVDTGSAADLFHPKIYVVTSNEGSSILVGSANLTGGGLLRNVEASLLLELSPDEEQDELLLTQMLAELDGLPAEYPENVTRIKHERQIRAMLASGILVDEDVKTPRVYGARKGGEVSDVTPRMKLHRKKARPSSIVITAVVQRAETTPGTEVPGGILQFRGFGNAILIWISAPLTERDLNIPSGGTTHATGSMGMKKGQLEGIDQRHFFRDEMFDKLEWTTDAHRAHLERATAPFHLIVEGIYTGRFELRLTHNTDTTSKTYKQRNFMTHLHWDDAVRFVAKRQLLGRIMRIYLMQGETSEFLIEID